MLPQKLWPCRVRTQLQKARQTVSTIRLLRGARVKACNRPRGFKEIERELAVDAALRVSAGSSLLCVTNNPKDGSFATLYLLLKPWCRLVHQLAQAPEPTDESEELHAVLKHAGLSSASRACRTLSGGPSSRPCPAASRRLIRRKQDGTLRRPSSCAPYRNSQLFSTWCLRRRTFAVLHLL